VSDPSDRTVIAVAVAHGRAESLDRVFRALRDQTRPPDGIVVVDSDAQPDVKDVLARWQAEDDRMQVTVLGRNGGSAGSFAAGLEAVMAKPEATHIAAFDDDAIPAPDCLEKLLEAADELGDTGVGAIGAVSMEQSGEFAWPMFMLDRREPVRSITELEAAAGGRRAVPVAELAWHALLIPVSTVRQVGPPRAELFMWYEDVEYGLRLRRAGLTAYAVVAAYVDHPPPKRVIRANILGVPLDVPIVSPSKAYLMTRNALVVRHEYVGPKFWFVDVPLTVARALIAIRALPGSKLALLREALLRPMADAARGRMGPPPPSLVALDESTRAG
jgi:GT2 family glycosyltransferase